MSVPTTDRPRGGRPLDAARDDDIRQAALELLAEQGYDRITVEAVAARARAGKATVYRRWASKADLMVDAINQLKPPVESTPDTGSLIGDLHSLFGVNGLDDNTFRVVCGVTSALSHDPELARAFRDNIVCPRQAVVRAVLERAVDRGEVPPDRDLDLLCTLFPALMLHRIVFVGEPPDPGFVERVIDHVIVPFATAPLSPAEQCEGTL
jgi:AcrR family transcriptional regulator